jgi:hypothetical protein
MATEPTRKIVRMTVEVIAEGRYSSAAELPDLIDEWFGGALEDRDDIRQWSFRLTSIEETDVPKGEKL